jgi:hypothetical protein
VTTERKKERFIYFFRVCVERKKMSQLKGLNINQAFKQLVVHGSFEELYLIIRKFLSCLDAPGAKFVQNQS